MGVAGSDSRASTIMSATPGWRSLTIDNESSQLAQCSLLLVRTALRNPRPPILRGSDAASFASASHWSSPTLRMAHRHLHNGVMSLCEMHGQLWPRSREENNSQEHWHNAATMPKRTGHRGERGSAPTKRCAHPQCVPSWALTKSL